MPFFFEPNFDAHIEPLPAALRLLKEKDKESEPVSLKKSVVYGEFLLGKVGNNFAGGKGKYDD